MSGFKSSTTDFEYLNKRLKELGVEPFYQSHEEKPVEPTWKCNHPGCDRSSANSGAPCAGGCYEGC